MTATPAASTSEATERPQRQPTAAGPVELLGDEVTDVRLDVRGLLEPGSSRAGSAPGRVDRMFRSSSPTELLDQRGAAGGHEVVVGVHPHLHDSFDTEAGPDGSGSRQACSDIGP